MKKRTMQLIVVIVFALVTVNVKAAAVNEIGERERCPVCGMFVAKYQTWAAQLHMKDGKILFFDGVKDMLALYFAPGDFGYNGEIAEIYIKDYYSQQWNNGKIAFYVIGSDVMGPMGHEFIPFASEDAAKSFLSDHHGKALLTFEQIDHDKVNELRSGKMGHSMHMMKKGQ